MVEEIEKSTVVIKDEAARSSSSTVTRDNTIDGGMGDESEAEEGEIVGGESDNDAAAEVAAPPPVKHPLEHSWTFWFDNLSAKNKQEEWGISMRQVFTFSSVEDFWSVYNNINRPSKLAVGVDFYCFKCKIEPKWEDPVCANGGTWTVPCPRGKFDTCWLYTLLAMIGEQFDHGDEICGAVVNVRGRHDRVALWTKNAANEAAQLSIGRQLKEFLDYNETIGFVFHEDAKTQGKAAKNKYTA